MKKQAEKENISFSPELMEQLHQCGQEILDVFVQICKENDLRYYLIAGTLLGAVRHKGPIPWDDDVDVCMPRSDFEKFKKIMLSRPKGETYHIYCFENDNNFSPLLIKLMKSGTVYNSQVAIDKNRHYRELWIDIFPLDNAPKDSGLGYRLHGKHISIMKRLMSYKDIQSNLSIKIKLLHFLLKGFSLKTLHNHTERLMCKWNDRPCDYYVNWASHYHFLKQTMPKKWYEPASELIYSGKYYCVPHEWDKVLTRLYNDYMKLPPKDEQNGHGAIEIKI